MDSVFGTEFSFTGTTFGASFTGAGFGDCLAAGGGAWVGSAGGGGVCLLGGGACFLGTAVGRGGVCCLVVGTAVGDGGGGVVLVGGGVCLLTGAAVAGGGVFFVGGGGGGVVFCCSRGGTERFFRKCSNPTLDSGILPTKGLYGEPMYKYSLKINASLMLLKVVSMVWTESRISPVLDMCRIVFRGGYTYEEDSKCPIQCTAFLAYTFGYTLSTVLKASSIKLASLAINLRIKGNGPSTCVSMGVSASVATTRGTRSPPWPSGFKLSGMPGKPSAKISCVPFLGPLR